MSKIILLNGCGSSGKTTISKAIQYLSNEPWLHIGVDNVIDLMPNRLRCSAIKLIKVTLNIPRIITNMVLQ